jgi:predicted DNA-binding transcriptional regulator AlpA
MNMPQKSLLDRIAEGEATLLGVDEICKRLSVSRATLDRWVLNGGGSTETLSSKLGSTVAPMSMLSDLASGDRTKFPPPDIRIGNSPRWELETFKEWLRLNMTNPNK